MNPDQMLTEMRSLARTLYEHWDGIRALPIDELEGTSFRLASLFNSMDESLSDGKAPPTEWTAKRPTSQ